VSRDLLVLSYFPAVWPPRSGGEARLGHLYRALGADWSVTLLSASDAGGAFAEVRHTERFRELRVPKDAVWERAAARLARSGLAGDRAGLALALAAADPEWGLRRMARDLAARAGLVVHESPFSEPLLAGLEGVREVYGAHNHEASLVGETATGAGAGEAWLRVWRLERRLARRAEVVLAPSFEDLERMRLLYGVEAHRLYEIPNGFDPEAAAAVAARRPPRPEERPLLAFLGSAHPPNVEAAASLATLAAEMPEADVVIAGGVSSAIPEGPPNLIRAGLLDPAAKADLLARASLFLDPVATGSGTSLKALEVAACGLPCLATPFAVRGLDLHDGVHLTLRERGPGFVAALRGLLADPGRAERMAEAARRAVAPMAWGLVARDLGRALAQAVDGRLGPHAPGRAPLVVALNDYPVAGRETGGAVRIRETLSRLDADTVLVTFADRPRIDRLGPRLLQIGLPKTPGHAAFERDLAALSGLTAEDVAAALFCADNPALSGLVADLAQEAGAAVFEHCYMAPLAATLLTVRPDLPVVYSAHNVEAALKRGSEGVAALVGGIAEGLERRLAALSERVVACSPEDAATFRAWGARTLLVGHGATIPDGEPAPPEGPPVLGFLGSGHGPNREAAAFIARVLAPSLPEMRFEILGEAGDGLGEPLPGNLRLLGALPAGEKARALSGWSLALNPVETGGGANLKLADYLAHGLPVLATPFGGRGFPIEAEGLGRIAPRESLARLAQHLLADPAGLAATARRARAFARTHLDWDRLTVPYRAEIGAMLARPGPPRGQGDGAVPTDPSPGQADADLSPGELAHLRATVGLVRPLVALSPAAGTVDPAALAVALAAAGSAAGLVVAEGEAARLLSAGPLGAPLALPAEAWIAECAALVVGGQDAGTDRLVALARMAGVPVVSLAEAGGLASETAIPELLRRLREGPAPQL